MAPVNSVASRPAASIIIQDVTYKIGRYFEYVKRELGKKCSTGGGSAARAPEDAGAADGGGAGEGHGRYRGGGPAAARPPRGRWARCGEHPAARRRAAGAGVGPDGGGERPLPRCPRPVDG